MSCKKSTQLRTILIPELEEAMAKQVVPREWTPREIAILKRYYNRVPLRVLKDHLPGRTRDAIRTKAQHMDLSYNRGAGP